MSYFPLNFKNNRIAFRDSHLSVEIIHTLPSEDGSPEIPVQHQDCKSPIHSSDMGDGMAGDRFTLVYLFHRSRKLLNPVFFWIALGAAVSVDAQVQFRGEFAAAGEYYRIDGRESRRPDNTWHLSFRPVLTFKHFSLPLEFFLSSEEERFRQPVNRFSLKPSWGWGGLQLGDFHTRHSEFTLNNIKMRGGALQINPGIFRLAVAGGRTQWEVEADTTRRQVTPAFRRNVYAASIGLGRENGSYLDLSLLKAEDDTTSLTQPGAARPQENLAAALSGQVEWLQSRLRLRGELAGAAYTRDARADAFTSEEIPSAVDDLYTLRLSSRVSSAFLGEGEYRGRSFALKGLYRRVNPGFVSLGLPYLINDLEQWKITPQLRLLQRRWVLRLSYGRRRDNLKDEKRFTTRRQELQLFSSYRFSRAFNLSGGFQSYRLDNDAPSENQRLQHHSWGLNLRPGLLLRTGALDHQLSLAFLTRQIDSGGALGNFQPQTGIYHFRGDWALLFPGGWRLAPGVQYQDNRTSGRESRWITYMLGGGAQLLRRSLLPSLTVSLNQIRNPDQSEDTQLGIVLGVQFRASADDLFSLNLRNSDYRSGDPLRRDFQELRAALRYTRRF